VTVKQRPQRPRRPTPSLWKTRESPGQEADRGCVRGPGRRHRAIQTGAIRAHRCASTLLMDDHACDGSPPPRGWDAHAPARTPTAPVDSACPGPRSTRMGTAPPVDGHLAVLESACLRDDWTRRGVDSTMPACGCQSAATLSPKGDGCGQHGCGQHGCGQRGAGRHGDRCPRDPPRLGRGEGAPDGRASGRTVDDRRDTPCPRTGRGRSSADRTGQRTVLGGQGGPAGRCSADGVRQTGLARRT
jgi:hypothetical protein